VYVLRLKNEPKIEGQVCSEASVVVSTAFEPGAKGHNGKGGIGGQGGVEGMTTQFEVKTVQHINRRRKRFSHWFTSLSNAVQGGVKKHVDSVIGGARKHVDNVIREVRKPVDDVIGAINALKGNSKPHQPIVRHVQLICSLESRGAQDHTTWSARAPSGKNGQTGSLYHSTNTASSTKQITDLSCSTLQASILQKLTDPAVAFESLRSHPH
jgi:hypothetical protein